MSRAAAARRTRALCLVFGVFFVLAALTPHKQDGLPFEVAVGLANEGHPWSDIYLSTNAPSVFDVSDAFLDRAMKIDPVFEKDMVAGFLSWPAALTVTEAFGGRFGLSLCSAVGSFFGLLVLSERMGSPKDEREELWSLWTLSMTGLLLMFGVAIGQTSPLLLLAVLAPRGPLAFAAGISIGVLAATKTWPILLVLSLRKENPRAAFTGLLFFVLASLAAWVRWGVGPFEVALELQQSLSNKVTTDLATLSIEALLLRDGSGSKLFTEVNPLLSSLVHLSGLGFLALFADSPEKRSGAVMIGAPLAWYHYFSVVPLGLLSAPRWVAAAATSIVLLNALWPTAAGTALATLSWLFSASIVVGRVDNDTQCDRVSASSVCD